MNRKTAVLMTLVLFLAAGCGRREEPPGANEHAEDVRDPGEHADSAVPGVMRVASEMLRDLRVTTTEVEARLGGERVVLLGDLGVDEKAYADVTFPVPARVVQVLAAPGDRIRAGESVAVLESPDLGHARADLHVAAARAALTSKTLERKRGLVEERIAPRRDLEEAEAQALAARAELDAARSTLRTLGVAEHDLDREETSARIALRSPVSGTVIERSAVVGQMCDPARPLFRVADLARLWLTTHAFERDAVRIAAGAPARVTFAAHPGRSFEGSVSLVGSQVDSTSRTIPVRIDLENPEGLLRPGMTASASVPLVGTKGPVVAVPTASLQRLMDGWVVFVPQAEEGAFEVRKVGRGRDLGNEVEIVSGLDAGETVVVDGAFLLKAQAEREEGAGHDH